MSNSKKYDKILHIFDPIYGQNYYYFNCKTYKEYQRLLKLKYNIEMNSDEYVEGSVSVLISNNTEILCIWTKGKKIDLIAHEVCHAVSHVLRGKGMPLSDDSEEAYAYLTQFLIKEIIR